ncbi:MAG: flippase [Chloroflexota bacterium]
MRSVGAIVARNSLFSLGGQIAVKLLSFAFTVFVVRRLGDATFGRYSTALAYVYLFAIFSDLGLGTYLVREVARDRSRIAELLSNVIVLRLILSAGTVALIVGSAAALGRPGDVVIGVFVAGCMLFAFAVQGPLDSVLIGRERLDYSAVFSIATQLVFVGLGTLVLLRGLSYVWLLAAQLVSVLSAAALSAIVVRRLATDGGQWYAEARLQQSRRRLPSSILGRPSPRKWPGLVRAALPFGVIGFTIGLSYHLDTVLLSTYRSDAEVGWYRAAYNLIFTLTMISHAICLALYPSLTRQRASLPQGLVRAYERALKYLFMLSIPIAVGATILAGSIILNLYREALAPAVVPLRILIWVLPLLFLSEFLGYVVIIADREQRAARALIVSTTCNVLLNLLLIPRFGYLAASVVTVITEAVLVGQYLWELRHELAGVRRVEVFGKPLLAALIMGLMLLALEVLEAPLSSQPVWLLARITLGGAVYVGVLWALRALGLEEVRFVVSALLRGRGPVAEADERAEVATL